MKNNYNAFMKNNYNAFMKNNYNAFMKKNYNAFMKNNYSYYYLKYSQNKTVRDHLVGSRIVRVTFRAVALIAVPVIQILDGGRAVSPDAHNLAWAQEDGHGQGVEARNLGQLAPVANIEFLPEFIDLLGASYNAHFRIECVFSHVELKAAYIVHNDEYAVAVVESLQLFNIGVIGLIVHDDDESVSAGFEDGAIGFCLRGLEEVLDDVGENLLAYGFY